MDRKLWIIFDQIITRDSEKSAKFSIQAIIYSMNENII